MKSFVKILAVTGLAAAFFFVSPVPIQSLGPLHDDTNPPCLGAQDPFCQPGDGSGGGSGSYCYVCHVKVDENNNVNVSCKSGSAGNTCTIKHHSNGDIDCEVEGAC